jgi:hypothetical protein
MVTVACIDRLQESARESETMDGVVEAVETREEVMMRNGVLGAAIVFLATPVAAPAQSAAPTIATNVVAGYVNPVVRK